MNPPRTDEPSSRPSIRLRLLRLLQTLAEVVLGDGLDRDDLALQRDDRGSHGAEGNGRRVRDEGQAGRLEGAEPESDQQCAGGRGILLQSSFRFAKSWARERVNFSS